MKKAKEILTIMSDDTVIFHTKRLSKQQKEKYYTLIELYRISNKLPITSTTDYNYKLEGEYKETLRLDRIGVTINFGECKKCS